MTFMPPHRRLEVLLIERGHRAWERIADVIARGHEKHREVEQVPAVLARLPPVVLQHLNEGSMADCKGVLVCSKPREKPAADGSGRAGGLARGHRL